MHDLVGYALLAVAGLAAGWVNSFAGAGSLLTLPALVFTGLDASAANATNRIAVLVQNVASLVAYERSGVRVSRAAVTLALPAMATAALGAWVATELPATTIRLCIAVAMIVMLGLSFVRPRRRTGDADRDGAGPGAARTPVHVTATMLAAFAGIGLYGGFLQAGVGIVILLALSLGWGVDLVTANGVKVLVILALTLVALATFILTRATIDVGRGAVLAATTAVGGYLGARTAVKRGERWVRWGVSLAVVASVAKLGWDLL